MNEASRKTSVKIKAEDGKIDEIVSTPGHMYYLPDNKGRRGVGEKLEHASYEGLNEKWVSAGLLKKGDKVLLANADSLTGKPKYGIVVSVKTEECEKFTTYNFEVEDFHTYYVGENGTLVHNAGPCELKPGTKEWNKAVKDIQNSANSKGKLNYTVKNQATAELLAKDAGLPLQSLDDVIYVHSQTAYTFGYEIHPIDNIVGKPHFKFWSGRTSGHIYWPGG